jgi:mono/diheme cytochrome c family protein
MRKILAIVSIAALMLTLFAFAGLARQGRRSVWGGVYTAAQAERGKVEYERVCGRCHAANFEGAKDGAERLGDFAPRFALHGPEFMERWREDTAFSLYTLISTGMPPRSEPGSQPVTLSPQAYLDIVAYLFQGNGFPAGQRELQATDLRAVRIQEQDGAKPLPSFSMVQTVGCLKQLKPGFWELAAAGEPLRVRDLAQPTPEELQAAAEEPLGNFEFDLQSIGYIGRDFSPSDYEGHKMLAKGVLIRQPPNVRIDIRSLVELAPSCE